MKTFPLLAVAKSLLAVSIFVFAQNLFAGDISFYGIFKEQDFVQTNNTAPISDTNGPALFQCEVDSSSSGLIDDASVQLPNSSSRTLVPDGSDAFRFRETFSSASALNAVYGTGTYSLTIDSENDGFNFAQLSMPSDAYSNTPQITNYTDAQSINPSNSFTIGWLAFSGGTSGDFIRLTLRDSSGDKSFDTGDFGSPDAFNGTNLSSVIPANTLYSGEVYLGELMFSHLTTIDSTSIPGATGAVVFTKKTSFSVKTTGTVPSINLHVLGLTNGTFQFSFTSQPGKNYQVQFADQLSEWQDFLFTNATSSETVISDTFSSGNPKRFFRVTVP